MIKRTISNKILILGKEVRDNFSEFSNFKDDEAIDRRELFTKITGEITKYDKGIKSMSWKTEYIVESDILIIKGEEYLKRLSKKYSIVNDVIHYKMKIILKSIRQRIN
jgi:hypothetical protein